MNVIEKKKIHWCEKTETESACQDRESDSQERKRREKWLQSKVMFGSTKKGTDAQNTNDFLWEPGMTSNLSEQAPGPI